MKQLFIFFFLIGFSISAQDFVSVDNLVLQYPRYSEPEDLAKRIARDFKDDRSKVRAIYRWLTHNIRYDLDAYYKPKRLITFMYKTEEDRLREIQKIKDQIVKEAFLRKLGVCEEYAQSFKKVADLLNIEAEVVKGYVRNSASEIGRVPRATNHAWNTVKVNNQWMVLDATWAAGYVLNGKWVKKYNEYFFDMPPKKIGKTHYPDSKKWKIIWNSGPIEKFYNQPIYAHRFLSSPMEVMNPVEGKIYTNDSRDIVLQIKNLSPEIRLYYNYKGQQYSKRPKISYKENIAYITIQNPRRNTDLYLFLNRSLALEYKVFVQ